VVLVLVARDAHRIEQHHVIAERIEGTVGARQPEALLVIQSRVRGGGQSVLGQRAHEVVVADGGVVFALDRPVHGHVGVPTRRDLLGRRVEAVRDQIAAAEDQVGLLRVDGAGGHHEGGGRLPFRAGMDVGVEDQPQYTALGALDGPCGLSQGRRRDQGAAHAQCL
jgi:hypothetical protein